MFRMRVADYIAARLAELGVTDVFLVTGGGAMHLNDAIGRCRPLRYTCFHHEQACAMAADAYARLTGRPAAVCVTTGPGGINALNGVFGAWVDSVPMVVVSGQVKRETCLATYGLVGRLRQLGDQEADIVAMVRGITKYAVLIDDPSTVRYHLERAVALARSGRPGPVWLDVPVDVQGQDIDVSSLLPYDPAEDALAYHTTDLPAVCEEVLDRIARAERPVVYCGSGVWASGAYSQFLAFIDRLGVPVVTAFNAHDLIWNDHPLYVGRPGTVGDRAGNFAVQHADLLLVVGSRLNIRQVSYAWKGFAPNAHLIMVDVDSEELQKPTLRVDLPVHADLTAFLKCCLSALEVQARANDRHATWLSWCRDKATRYPVVLPEYWNTVGCVNPYAFTAALFAALEEEEVIVTADGTACVVTFQAAFVRKGQRLFHNSGCASMGFDLPAAVGAAKARPGQRIVCLAGDGSMMMNLQELQTIVGAGLPVKVFLLNNEGYHSIRQTQANFFPDNPVGCGAESGVQFPAWEGIAQAFGLRYSRCADPAELPTVIADTLAGSDATLCEIVLDLRQPFAPRVTSRRLEDGTMASAALDDMAPFLDRDELEAIRGVSKTRGVTP